MWILQHVSTCSNCEFWDSLITLNCHQHYQKKKRIVINKVIASLSKKNGCAHFSLSFINFAWHSFWYIQTCDIWNIWSWIFHNSTPFYHFLTKISVGVFPSICTFSLSPSFASASTSASKATRKGVWMPLKLVP